MREYHKIETLFERDADFRVTSVLKRQVFADIAKWIVTEKVDGTNIRVSKVRGEPLVKVGGRTDKAQTPADLVNLLHTMFTPEKMDGLFTEDSSPVARITLFGEGYGAGIQKGGHYRPDKSFILFDVLIEVGEESWWQDDAVVTDFAARLGCDRVPILGEWVFGEIVERVKAGVVGKLAPDYLAEGIVARTREPLFDSRGRRLILKLKTQDFIGGKM